MQAAVVMWWKDAVPGRELAAVDLYEQTSALCRKAVDDGVATDYSWYVGQPSVSMLIVKGEFESLAQFLGTQEMQAVIMKAGIVNTDFNTAWYYTGETVDGLMDVYADLVRQVG
jgi:hypothetical protein